MPTPDTLNRFIAMVESNAHVEAIEAFYGSRRPTPAAGALPFPPCA